MIESLKQLKTNALQELSATKDLKQLDDLVLKYFGRKQGQLNTILRSLKSMDERQKKILGSEANEVKIEIWRLIDLKREEIRKSGKQEFIDLTLDGTKSTLGHLHPITKIEREIEAAFRAMGYAIMRSEEHT